VPQNPQDNGEAAAASSNGKSAAGSAAKGGDEASFDINADSHKGEFALRKLYHESNRPLVVLYTGGWRWVCRWGLVSLCWRCGARRLLDAARLAIDVGWVGCSYVVGRLNR
jgi:hypothetical protein